MGNLGTELEKEEIINNLNLKGFNSYFERILKEICGASFFSEDLNSSKEWLLRTAPSATAERRKKTNTTQDTFFGLEFVF